MIRFIAAPLAAVLLSLALLAWLAPGLTVDPFGPMAEIR